MIKKFSLVLLTVLCTISIVNAQGSESFSNLNAPAGSYSDGSYVGDNTVTWTYGLARTVTSTYNITGTSIGFQSVDTRYVSALSGINGVGDVTYSVRSYFTGGTAGDRSIEVYVNGLLKDSYTLAAMGTVYTRTITAGESGDVTIEFRSTGSRQIVLDDISWTSFSTAAVDWCNLQFPEVGSITTGGVFDVFGQVYEAGVTPGVGQGAGITAWVGYNSTDTNPNTWTNWVPAGYNNSCADCNSDQNDEYFVDIGAVIPTAGTYYYATRFQLNGGPYRYGGILADGTAGDFWDGSTYISGELTITDPPVSDVVITEIMYNTTGVDDEWIEICNISGSPQDISNYIIDVSGTTEFTFPASTTIADDDCITIDLGDGGGTEYNVDCPFTPDYSSSSVEGTLSNTNPETITLYASNGITVADVVTYDDSNGADGNTASLHLSDATLDNINANANWQEVFDGGSPGANVLISPCTPLIPEINVEGVVGGFPNIMDGDVTPQGTDNTLFAQQIIGNSQLKSYRIQNLGAVDLTINNIFINGANAGDFTVGSYTYPFTIAPGVNFIFSVTFSPLAVGQRNATVNITNDDADENPYNYAIRGNGVCAAAPISLSPSSGPAGTIVTVTGANFGTTNTAASIDGFAASVTYLSPTLIEVTIPDGADADNLEITDESNCLAISFFTVLTYDVANCEGASGVIPPNWNDLLITGVYDNTSGSCHYLELFNPTGAPIDLTASVYEIGLSNNFLTPTSTPFTFNAGREALTGVVAPYSTYVVRFGNQGDTCNDCPTIIPDETIEGPGFGINGNNPDGVDRIVLIKNFVNVDLWGNDLYGGSGYVYTRSPEDGGGNPVTATAPNMSWDTTDWASQSTADCFAFQYVPASPPLVNTNPSYIPDCNILSTTLSVSATEGYNLGDDTQELTYQWYYSMPGDPGWTEVTNNAIYSGATTVSLTISDILNTADFQFYCQIREDDNSCSAASDAVRIDVPRTIWYDNGSVVDWSNGAPTASMIAVIDEAYNTAANGNIDACNLVIYAGRNLGVGNSSYVRVVNNVVNNGTITVQTRGSFVQDGDDGSAGTFTNSGAGTSNVLKSTTVFNDAISGDYNYTYWSSPVFGSMINTVFPNPVGNRRYYFAGELFRDSFAETINDNNLVAGQDDIDDDDNDWVFATGQQMTVGRGYAVTAVASPFPGSNFTDSANFIGDFNTGNLNFTVYRNNNELNDNNWNFTGNPYASAISADAFISENVYLAAPAGGFPTNTSGVLDGALFLWSQSIPADANTIGNENFNFNQNDYAVINLTGETAGNSGTTPSRFIPSGQGFFVSYSDDASGTDGGGLIFSNSITFKNSMRMADTSSNNQFFGIEENTLDFNGDAENGLPPIPNKLWIDLTSDNGVFNQILIGYVDGATEGYDGMKFDAVKNLSASLYSSLYSIIDNTDKVYTIQGKSPESLSLDEVIPLGFSTIISEPTLYKFTASRIEGDFLNSNPIYVKDYYMDITHNLSDSDYVFTSDTGDFRERFEIVFTEDALSLGENDIDPNDLSIIELSNGDVKFFLSGNHLMNRIEIIDFLGRSLYVFDAQDSSDITYNLSNLSQAAYVAVVTLDNGYVITKKAIKRK